MTQTRTKEKPIRDISKILDEYQRMTAKGGKFGSFYVSDVQQIADMTNPDTCTALISALEAGFVIGYHAAKRKRA